MKEYEYAGRGSDRGLLRVKKIPGMIGTTKLKLMDFVISKLPVTLLSHKFLKKIWYDNFVDFCVVAKKV